MAHIGGNAWSLVDGTYGQSHQPAARSKSVGANISGDRLFIYFDEYEGVRLEKSKTALKSIVKSTRSGGIFCFTRETREDKSLY